MDFRLPLSLPGNIASSEAKTDEPKFRELEPGGPMANREWRRFERWRNGDYRRPVVAVG